MEHTSKTFLSRTWVRLTVKTTIMPRSSYLLIANFSINILLAYRHVIIPYGHVAILSFINKEKANN